MRKYIQKQIEIALKPFYEKLSVSLSENENRVDNSIARLDWFMNEYHANKCGVCGKPILAHYGGFYRNSEGKVFCSTECIDKNKEIK